MQLWVKGTAPDFGAVLSGVDCEQSGSRGADRLEETAELLGSYGTWG